MNWESPPERTPPPPGPAHRIVDHNGEGAGTCSLCGPVDVTQDGPGSNRLRCGPARRARRRGKPQDARSRHHGLRRSERDPILAGATCALCPDPGTELDHCHATGKIREPLCRAHNLMLGHAQDDPDLLRRAAAYLERHAAV